MSRLYTNTKIFHFHEKLEDMKAGRISVPLHIRIKPTNRCNHRCAYCCYRNPDLYLSELMDEGDEIPQAKMHQLIADLAEMGVRAVTFSGGGEPLCYPHIVEAFEALLLAGIQVAMLSNGSLLKGPAAKVLAQGATWVRISMEGTDSDSYAGFRGVGDREFDRICENIRTFARDKRGDCELGINLVVLQENHRDVFSFLKRMKDLGADHVKISECIVSTSLEENRKYTAPILPAVREQIEQAMDCLVDEQFNVIDRIGEELHSCDSYCKPYTWCPFIQYLTVIGADGNVYACQDKAYARSGMLGSIRDGSFRDLWFSDELKGRLIGLDPREACNHHCVQHQKNLMILDYLAADAAHLAFV